MPRDVRAPSGALIRQDGKDAPMILLSRLEFELYEDATHMTFNTGSPPHKSLDQYYFP